MPGILTQLIGNKHAENMQKELYKLESARGMIQEEAKNPGTYNPAMIQMAADTLGMGVPKDQQPHFHRALGQVLPHLFGSKKMAQPANGGAMSSGGSAAPQAVMTPPPDPNTTTPNYGGMPSLPAPPTEPLQASGQAGSGPAVPSDTQAPQPAPQITSPPSAGFTSLTPPPGPFLRNGPSVPFHVNTLDERVQANAPGLRAQAQMAQEVTQRMHQWLTTPKEQGGGGLNAVQAADYLNKHQVQYEPTTKLSEGDVLANNTSGNVIAAGAPKITTIAPGGMGTMVDPAARLTGSIPPPPGAASNGVSSIQGPPPLPSKRAIESKSAYTAFRQSTDPTYKWSENDLPKAEAYFKESSMSPTERIQKDLAVANLREVRINNQLRQQEMNQHIQEFKQTKGPEAIDAMADQIYIDPESVKKINGDMYSLVAQRFRQKYGLTMPTALEGDMPTRRGAALVAVNNIDSLKQMLADPVIQKRIGSWNGRFGELEQAFGSTAGLSTEEERKIQAFRTQLSYLFAQESKAAFGGRTAASMMEDLKKASPSVKKGLPMLLGSLDGARAAAGNIIVSADMQHFGGKVRPEIQQQFGMSAPPGRLAPPKVGEVREGHRFKGGNPGLQANWEPI